MMRVRHDRATRRVACLAVASMLGIFLVLTAGAGGGITIMSLLLFVLCLAAVTSLLARTTNAWMPRLRARS